MKNVVNYFYNLFPENIYQKNTEKQKSLGLFLNANIRLVLSIVGRFSGVHENADDMFQAGMIGLIKSLNNFDYSYGVCFSTYAVPMIIGEIRRYLRDNNAIRVSRSLRDTAYKALSAKEKLANEKGRGSLPCPVFYDQPDTFSVPTSTEGLPMELPEKSRTLPTATMFFSTS